MRETSRENIFELSHVWFRFDGDSADADSFLFRDLSLTIEKGQSVAIIGPSGEGKSTLIKLMTGLLVPTRGTSRTLGADLAELGHSERVALMRRMGMTFQNSGLFDSLSCGENLGFPLEESGVTDREEMRRKIRAALEEVGLPGIEPLRTHQISGGMRKRLGIARAHILSPEVVIYDEPTAGLDPLTSRAISDLILNLKNHHHVSVIVVTNDPAQAFRLGDRVLFIEEGKILLAGTPQEIAASQLPEVRKYLDAFTQMGAPA